MPESDIEYGFVEEDEFLHERIPDGVEYKFVSPRSLCFGVDDDVLDATVFTNVKMELSDFEKTPKKLPRLLFANKNRVDENPGLVAGISPLLLVLRASIHEKLITGCTDEADSKIIMLMRENYLLLPLYLTKWQHLAPWGIDVVAKNMRNGAAGKLPLKKYYCRGCYLFGKKCRLRLPCYCGEFPAFKFWRVRYYNSIARALGMELANYDIGETIMEVGPCAS